VPKTDVGRWQPKLTSSGRGRQDLIAETPADDIEGVGIKLALYVYMSGVDPETADSAVELVLSAAFGLSGTTREATKRFPSGRRGVGQLGIIEQPASEGAQLLRRCSHKKDEHLRDR